MWGMTWGYIWGYGCAREEDKSPARICPSFLAYLAGLRGSLLEQRLYVEAYSSNACAWLDQIQLYCPFDRRPAIGDVEFAVDALGIGADCAQGDHKFASDLWPRKLSAE